MKISASDARIGNLIEYQGKLWRILKKEHVKPGKGGAFAQLEMKALKDEVQLNFYNENPIGMELPTTVSLEVVDTESVVKGQTASGSGKPAILETGLRVTVPSFINIGDCIRINTDTGEYLERA